MQHGTTSPKVSFQVSVIMAGTGTSTMDRETTSGIPGILQRWPPAGSKQHRIWSRSWTIWTSPWRRRKWKVRNRRKSTEIAIDVPNSHWLVDEKRGVWRNPCKTTGFHDDRWYNKPAPLFLPKGHYWKSQKGWTKKKVIRWIVAKSCTTKRWLKPNKFWDKAPINRFRISTIRSMDQTWPTIIVTSNFELLNSVYGFLK